MCRRRYATRLCRDAGDGLELDDVVDVLDVLPEQYVEASVKGLVAYHLVSHENGFACRDVDKVSRAALIVAEENAAFGVCVVVGGETVLLFDV